MLPPGFERRVLTTISIKDQKLDISALNEHQQTLLELLKQKTKFKLNEIEKLLGKKRTTTSISQLVEAGLIERTYEFEPVKVKTRQLPYLRLTVDAEKALETAGNMSKKAPKQASLLKMLSAQTDSHVPCGSEIKSRLRYLYH